MERKKAEIILSVSFRTMARQGATKFANVGVKPRHIPASLAKRLVIKDRGASARKVMSNLGLKDDKLVVSVIANLKQGKVQGTR